tara:strand:- start:971 stop:3649 length:2679 start_codon:yes stop_codon:yes gene_type:complete
MKKSVTTEFDVRDSCFSISGFLNFMMRYGGGVGDFSGGTGAQARKIALAANPEPFKDLRKGVLEQADETGRADDVIRKIITFSGEAAGGVSQKKPQALDPADTKRLDDVRKSIACSPAYKVVPQIAVSRKDQTGFIAINTMLKPTGNTGIIVQPKGVSVNLVANQGVAAGSIPVYEGTLELDFFSITKNKKINILQQLAQNPETLGYLFRLDKDWVLELRNIAKPQKFHNPKDKEAYEALVNTDLKFNANTFRYEMTSWKPYENRATFTIYFKQALEHRDKITAAGFKGVNVKDDKNAIKTLFPSMTKTQRRAMAQMEAQTAAAKAQEEEQMKRALKTAKSYSLMDGILYQLQHNGSLFLYTFTIADRSLVGPDTLTYQIRNTETPDAQTLEQRTQNKPTVKNGSFFLFRSLLVAVIQTFYKKETSLHKEAYKNILFDEEYFNKLLLILDQTNMPTEVGTFFSEGPDIRNTFETMVVEFQVFTQFMHDLHQKNDRVTFDFFLTSLFNDLVPRILKASLNPKGADKERYRTLYKEQVVFDMSIKDIESSLGQNYSTIFRDVNLTELALKRRRSMRTVYRKGLQYTEKLTTQQLEPYGNLKFKNVSGMTVVNSVINVTEESQTARAIIIDRNDSSPSIIIDSETKQKKQLFEMKNAEIRRKGLIPLDWYLKSSPENNLKFRILANQNETPFQFAVMTDKDAENLRRLAAGEKPFISNIYTVSFTVADVLGITPYVTRFVFKPEFFGFSDASEDSFGFSGAYQCDSVSISYNPANLRFEASVSMVYDAQTSPKARGAVALGDRTPLTKANGDEDGISKKDELRAIAKQSARIDKEILEAESSQARSEKYADQWLVSSSNKKRARKNIEKQKKTIAVLKSQKADLIRQTQQIQQRS